jgi:hypothetical protein
MLKLFNIQRGMEWGWARSVGTVYKLRAKHETNRDSTPNSGKVFEVCSPRFCLKKKLKTPFSTASNDGQVSKWVFQLKFKNIE